MRVHQNSWGRVSQARNSGYKIDDLVRVQTTKYWNWMVGMLANAEISQHDPSAHGQGFSHQKEVDDRDII